MHYVTGLTILVLTTDPTQVSGNSIPVAVGTILVTVSPSSANITVGATQQFTATVQGTSNTAVTWSVNGVTGGNSTVGTITDQGLYTAPATVPTPANVTVSAASQVDPNAAGSAVATVVVTLTNALTVYPSTASVSVSAVQQFTATVQSVPSTSMVWSVNGVAGGSSTIGMISDQGQYISLATIPTPATVTITATSQDTGQSGSSTATIIAATGSGGVDTNPAQVTTLPATNVSCDSGRSILATLNAWVLPNGLTAWAVARAGTSPSPSSTTPWGSAAMYPKDQGCIG